jgi:hypothetical protein
MKLYILLALCFSAGISYAGTPVKLINVDGSETTFTIDETVSYYFIDGKFVVNAQEKTTEYIGDEVPTYLFEITDSDIDEDGIPDHLDADADNDGVDNSEDAFPLYAEEQYDFDNDGTGDNTDTDIDGDWVFNDIDAFPYDSTESADFDGDGIGDAADLDDDNDAVSDSLDQCPNTEANVKVDEFGCVWVDTDSDNDGVLDSEDECPDTESGIVVNEKGCPVDIPIDTDLDGTPDETDTDDDNDGVNDAEDQFPFDKTEWADTDLDGTGNNADADDDNDGTADIEDGFPLDSTEDTDTDNDGVGNNADTDDDNDGVSDENDLDPLDANIGLQTAVLSKNADVLLYPNPSKTVVFVEGEEILFHSFVSSEGVLMNTISIEQNTNGFCINVSTLSTGLYTIFIEQNGQLIAKTVIVE